MRQIVTITYIFLAVLFLSSSVRAGKLPIWWKQVRDEAKRDAYSLVTLDNLKKLYESEQPFLIIDARARYEYNEGHLPKAVSFEFDPGDKLQLKPDKKAAFLKLLGPDKNRKIIIYCRGFR